MKEICEFHLRESSSGLQKQGQERTLEIRRAAGGRGGISEEVGRLPRRESN